MTNALDSLPSFARAFASGDGVTRVPVRLRAPISRRAWRAMTDEERAEHLAAKLAEERAERKAPASRRDTPAPSSATRASSRPVPSPRAEAPVAASRPTVAPATRQPIEATRARESGAQRVEAPALSRVRYWIGCAVCGVPRPASSSRAAVVTCEAKACQPRAETKRAKRLAASRERREELSTGVHGIV